VRIFAVEFFVERGQGSQPMSNCARGDAVRNPVFGLLANFLSRDGVTSPLTKVPDPCIDFMLTVNRMRQFGVHAPQIPRDVARQSASCRHKPLAQQGSTLFRLPALHRPRARFGRKCLFRLPPTAGPVAYGDSHAKCAVRESADTGSDFLDRLL
jgi:hypothetical protein